MTKPENHISISDLLKFVQQGAASTIRLESHLETCTDCQTKVDWLRTLSEVIPSEDAFEPPEALVQKLLEIGPQRNSAGFVRRILGSLIYDGFTDPLPAGVRRSESSAHQLVYEAGDYYISVRIDGQESGLFGQILNKTGLDSALDRVRLNLCSEGRVIETVAANKLGEFSFEKSPSLNCDLEIQLDTTIIAVRISQHESDKN